VIRAARRGGTTVVTHLSGTEPWRPRILSASRPLARVALIQSRATLLAGDRVTLEVGVGEGAALELVELAATVAHDARGAQLPAVVSVEINVESGGALVWLAQPLIVASGANAARSTEVCLERNGRTLLGEPVVLGRAREEPGALTARTRITWDGTPTIDETLRTADLATLRSPVVAGTASMLGVLTLVGVRDDQAPAGTMRAHGPALLWRAAGTPAQLAPIAARLTAHWRQLAIGPGA
jgi:urease accessory protein